MSEVELVPVSASDFPEFRERALQMYVEQLTRAEIGRPEDIPSFAERDFGRLLPDGPTTPDQFVYWLRSGSSRVGMLWFGIRRDPPPTRGYVYAVEVFEEFQRRGHGKAAMLAVEGLARRHHLDLVSLNVFNYNRGAIHLYEKLGYETFAQQMTKRLGPAPR